MVEIYEYKNQMHEAMEYYRKKGDIELTEIFREERNRISAICRELLIKRLIGVKYEHKSRE